MGADNTRRQIAAEALRENGLVAAALAVVMAGILSWAALASSGAGPAATVLVPTATIAVGAALALAATRGERTEPEMPGIVAVGAPSVPGRGEVSAMLRDGDSLVAKGEDRSCWYVSSPADDAAVSADPSVSLDGAYSYPGDVVPYAAALYSRRRSELLSRGVSEENKAVCGLVSLDGGVLTVRSTSRFAVQTTDDAYGLCVIDRLRLHDKVLFDAATLMDAEVMRGGVPRAASQLDLCALVVSSDGYMVFRAGNVSHPLFPGRALVTVSASMCPDDAGKGRLSECAAACLRRKARDAYPTIGDRLVAEMAPVAMIRVVGRCGAPEVCLVARADATYAEIRDAHAEPTCNILPEEGHRASEAASVDLSPMRLSPAVSALLASPALPDALSSIGA